MADADDSVFAARRGSVRKSVGFSSDMTWSKMRRDVASGLPSRLTATMWPSSSVDEIEMSLRSIVPASRRLPLAPGRRER